MSVGSNADGVEAHSVGNTGVLLETALIEAFNLKAAIEYLMKNGLAYYLFHDIAVIKLKIKVTTCDVSNYGVFKRKMICAQTEEAAREALANMPPRAEEELDPVTLHNQALMNMDSDPTT